jgi:hypothetical protein
MANMPSIDRMYLGVRVSNETFVALEKVAKEANTTHTEVARSVLESEMTRIVNLFSDEDKAAVAALKRRNAQRRRDRAERVMAILLEGKQKLGREAHDGE